MGCSFSVFLSFVKLLVMRQAHSITIDTRSLKKGVHPFSFTPSPESVDLDPAKFFDIRVDGSLSITSSGIIVSLTAEAVATLECDRTLVDFDQQIAGTFEGIVVDATDYPDLDAAEAQGGGRTEESAAGSDPVDLSETVPMYEGVVVLDSVVRDTLLLAIPMRKVSPQAAAMELKLEFGDDESGIDPRWEALRKLKGSGGE